MPPLRVLLATTNPAKQAELRRLMDGLPLEAVTPSEATVTPPEEPPGSSHLKIAIAKARAWASVSGLRSLASDGGLHIPALGDAWNGLHNRRFAGPSDDDRIEALLALMDGLVGDDRAGCFREAVALALPDGRVIAALEAVGPEGRIAATPDARKRPGFWVSSVWLHPPRWVTEFDLTLDECAALDTTWRRVARELRPAMAEWAAGAHQTAPP